MRAVPPGFPFSEEGEATVSFLLAEELTAKRGRRPCFAAPPVGAIRIAQDHMSAQHSNRVPLSSDAAITLAGDLFMSSPESISENKLERSPASSERRIRFSSLTSSLQ